VAKINRLFERNEDRIHWNVKKLDESLWNGLIWHRIRKFDMCTEHGNEKNGSVKIGYIHDLFRN